MREQLKNELLLMLDKYCDNTTLPLISQKLELAKMYCLKYKKI